MGDIDKQLEEMDETFEDLDKDKVEEVEEGKSKTIGDGEGTPSYRKGEDPLTSRGFSFTRLFRALATQDWSEAKLENEVSTKLKDVGYDTREDGTLVPFNSEAAFKIHGDELRDFGHDSDEFMQFMNREYSSRVTTEGDNVGSLVEPAQADDFIELLRNESVVEEAGARVLDLPKSGQLNIPKMKNGATAYWLAENGALTSSDLNTGDIKLRSKYLGCLVKASKQSLRHSTPSLEQLIREDMSREMALKEDYTFLYGTSASEGGAGSDIPSGLLDYDDSIYTTTYALSDKDHIIDMDAELSDVTATGWLMNKKERAKILKIEDTGGNAVFLGNFRDGGSAPGEFLGIPVIVSEQLDDDDLFLGDFRQALIARDMVLEITTTDQTEDAFTKNQVWFKAMLGVDFGIRHEEGFLYNDAS